MEGVDLGGAVWHRSEPLRPAASDAEQHAGGNAVEVAFVGDVIAVRDASDPDGPALIYTRDEWDAFIAGVKDGEFDR